MYLLYSVLFTLGLILTAPYYAWKHRGKLDAAAWKERFGFLQDHLRQSEPGAIWVHAVSVGETLAVAGLIQELRALYPARKVFLSHVTPAGREAGERRIPDVAGRFYLPFDWGSCVWRVLKILRPAMLVIVETELWPNLLRAARRSGCRIVLVNARLSKRSFPKYFRIRGLMRRVLAQIDCVCVQSEADAVRFRQLGADPRRVSVTGNLKFDARPSLQSELAIQLKGPLEATARRPVLIAASTMAKEEPLVLEAWQDVLRQHPKALLMLAPRHSARFAEVANMLADAGIAFVRRTDLAAPDQRPGQIETVQAILLDSIGELGGIFQLADLVFIGGTLVPTGGHNLLEPAFWGKAIVLGPHMENFRDAAELFVRAGAAVQISNPSELGVVCSSLLSHSEELQRLGMNARRVLEQQSGATQRTLDQIARWLGPDSAARAAS
jgi:3-deoxy-D-manno-octulosonic-acid transferase